MVIWRKLGVLAFWPICCHSFQGTAVVEFLAKFVFSILLTFFWPLLGFVVNAFRCRLPNLPVALK